MSSFLSAVPAIGTEPRRDLLALGRREQRLDGPVFVGLEGLDLGLAIAHEAQRHGLHPPGRARARQLAPQHRRQREADEIVERAARQIGRHQRLRRSRAAGFMRVEHRLLGDRVEGHALDRRALLERLLLLEHPQDVPGDGLALAVGVGGQDQLVGVLHGVRDLSHDLGGLAVDVPVHLEVVVGLDRAVLRRQVAHVPVARRCTLKPEPRYLLMVLALAADSTMTTFMQLRCCGVWRAAQRAAPMQLTLDRSARRRRNMGDDRRRCQTRHALYLRRIARVSLQSEVIC